MKKYILFALAFAFTLGSCYEDDSKRADFSLLDQRVLIITGTPIYGTTHGGTLSWRASSEEAIWLANFSPRLGLRESTGENDFDLVEFTEEDYDLYDYRWRLARNPGRTAQDTSQITISWQRDIVDYEVEVGASPDYRLLLEVTEKSTGMRYNLNYRVDVARAGGSGPGLMVADTRDGGLTSDISLLRAYPWDSSSDYVSQAEPYKMPPAAVLRDFYSRKNGGTKLDGKVSSLIFTYSTNAEAARRHIDFVVEGKHVVRTDLDFVEIGRDAALFRDGLPANFNPQMIYTQPMGASYMKSVLVNDGDVFFHRIPVTIADHKFMPMNTSPVVKVSPKAYNRITVSGRHGMFFDETNGRMIGLPSATFAPTWTAWAPFVDNEDGVFRINELSGVNCLYVGMWVYGYNYTYGGDPWPMKMAYLMSDKATGKRSLYIMSGAEGDGAGTPVMTGEAIFDMSNCTDFDRSTVWANSHITTRNNYGHTNTVQPEFWYAVDNKIYAVTPNFGDTGGAPTSQVVFTFPEDEKVTIMDWSINQYQFGLIFHQWTPSGNYQSMAGGIMNNMMTVATWDGTEGRVYAFPRAFHGTGQFLNAPATPENEFVFMQDGFGEITAIHHRQNF